MPTFEVYSNSANYKALFQMSLISRKILSSVNLLETSYHDYSLLRKIKNY